MPVFLSLPLWGQFENLELAVPQKDHSFVFPETENTLVSKAGNIDPILVDMLNATLEQELTLRSAVGLTAAVILPDGEAWTGAIGKHNAAGEPITTDMVSGVGSVTKTVTGACILQLMEEGKLNLDDPIHTYLDTFQNIPPSATIRQLLNHTSGIYSYTDNPAVNAAVSQDYSRVWMPEEILQNFVLAPLFNPGDSWAYSNTNYVLLGMIIEEVTGNEFHAEIRTRFWEKLNLEDVYLYPQETSAETFVNLWADLFGGGTALDVSILGVTREGLFSLGWAAGAIISTPESIARWMKALTDGEAISPMALSYMEDFLPLTNEYGYGLGLSRTLLPDGTYVFGHSGNIIYQSEVNAVPDQGISIAVLTNDGTVTQLPETWYALYLTYQAYLTMSDVTEAAQVNPLKVYPNPAAANVVVALDELQLDGLEVRNALGQIVWTSNHTLQGTIEIPSSSWAPGLYHLTGKSENALWQSKIIKN